MSKILVEKPHSLSVDQAKEALKSFEGDLAKYGLKPEWKGNKAELKGTGASGEIRIEASKVVVEIKLGMLAKAAGIKADKVQASIEKRLGSALA
ncbi:MAG: polyhydroxyalkanoic acid system family protein [Pseudomonadota bacterium]